MRNDEIILSERKFIRNDNPYLDEKSFAMYLGKYLIFNEKYLIFNEELKRFLRSPKRPSLVPDTEKNIRKKKSKPSPQTDRAKILSPLEEVFFEDELMDDLIVRTSVPQLLEGQAPIYPGVILFGPPGTGKSEFQKAVCRVYENAGAYAKQVSTSAVNSCFVGEFAKNLEKELKTANEQGELRAYPQRADLQVINPQAN